MLALKRMRRRAGIFVAIAGVVALLAGMSVGLSGYLASAAASGARAGVAALSGIDGGFRISTPLTTDEATQDAELRADVRSAVRADGRPVPMNVIRDVVSSNPVPFDRAGRTTVRAAAASIPDLMAHARLIAGAWPHDASQVSMQADAAASSRIRVGDALVLPDGTTVTVTATWRVVSASDPRWLEDPVALSGTDLDGTRGWIVIDPTLWAATHDHPIVRWTIRPEAGRVTVSQLDALQHAQDAVSDAVQKRHPSVNVQAEGLLQLGLLPIQQNLQAAAAVSTAPLVVVALLGLITLLELAGMLDQVRSGETALVRARGTSARRSVLQGVVEGLVAAVPGVAVGVGIALLPSIARGHPVSVPGFAWVVAGVVAAAPAVVLGVSAGRSARERRPAAQGRSGLRLLGGEGRLRSTLALGVLLLIVLLAVVAVSQFLLYGSPLAPLAGGGSAVDPLAVSAPALAIAAMGLLAIAVFPLLARAWERGARRARDVDALSLRQLARRSRSALTPILVIAFAVSGLLLGVCYSGTWTVSARDTRQVQVGTSVRITASPPLSAAFTRSTPGQLGAAPVAREDAQLGQELIPILGIPSSRVTAAVVPVGGAVDPAALARLVTTRVDRPRIPAAATGVDLVITATPASALPIGGSLLAVDAVGSQIEVNLLSSRDGLAGELPTGVTPWTVHGISLLLPDIATGASVAVELHATGGSTARIPLDTSWSPSGSTGVGRSAGPLAGRAGLGTAGASPAGYVLLQSVRSGSSRLPVVISRSLAEASGLAVGSKVPMQLVSHGGSVPVRVAAVVPVIPGTPNGEGILADLGALQDAAAREGLLPVSSGEWWVRSATPSTAAAVERRDHPDAGVEVAAPSAAEQVLESARIVVWIAALATALLAFLAIGSGLLAELRSREDEVRILRAVGASPRVQSAVRVREWALLLGVGVVAGAIDGAIVCAMLVPSLARTAVPNAIDQLRTNLNLDLPGALFALLGIAVTVGVLLAIVARSVRVQARRSAAAPGGSAR